MLDKLFIVLVLYKTSLEESKTIRSLCEVLDYPIDLLVYDNSPTRQYQEEYFQYDKFKVHYRHDKLNLGLSTAYNFALEFAMLANKPWLLLLDQDTTFTREYILQLSGLEIEKLSENVVAIIPKVISLEHNQMISPSKMLIGGICRPINVSAGILDKPISGINSGSILSVSYLKSMEGFDLKYSLDMLDHWYFRKIYRDAKNVTLLNSTIYQDLSILGDFEANVSFERYKQMLTAEMHFISEDGFLSKFVFKVRLLVRVIKQMRYKDSRYYKVTIKQIFS
ncbi:glycosyltransferase [Flavobacterium sp. AC]|uniref:Glycosyltransferase n=1 Tax=Flavobacterium azizsancarii TaxID=2961580 RepID=A0ABT4W8I9_9FLAO|nr:glycosyltransferase [Flavobacterium azizsancarii]MDA6068802.1 glycosyltransferase [Flavobacterium azizsancarii]